MLTDTKNKMFYQVNILFQEEKNHFNIEINEIKKSLIFPYIKLDEYKNKNKICEDKLITLEKHNPVICNENNGLSLLISKVQNDVNDSNQYLLRNNIKIQGTPFSKNEIVLHILESMAKYLNITFNKNEICNVYRKHLKMELVQ